MIGSWCPSCEDLAHGSVVECDEKGRDREGLKDRVETEREEYVDQAKMGVIER